MLFFFLFFFLCDTQHFVLMLQFWLLFVCVYVCMCVYVYACVCVYVCTCVCVCAGVLGSMLLLESLLTVEEEEEEDFFVSQGTQTDLTSFQFQADEADGHR